MRRTTGPFRQDEAMREPPSFTAVQNAATLGAIMAVNYETARYSCSVDLLSSIRVRNPECAVGLTEEERKFRRRRVAKLRTVNSFAPDTSNPVRILCIVVEAQSGAALVQDIIDEPGKQGSIQVSVDDTLSVAEKYILIGDVQMTSGSEGKELRLFASHAYNVNSLDVKLYKEALNLERRVNQA